MGWFSRRAGRLKRSAQAANDGRGMDTAAVGHLTEFVQTRRGVEAFMEPKTAISQTTMLLVAFDGEWTRRSVPSEVWGHKFAEHLQIPGYDAAVVGYPQRMRDYNSRMKKQAQQDR